jgi:hypothetical protein
MGTGFIRRQATIGQSAVGTGAYSFSGALTGLPGGDLLAGFGDGSPFSLGERADTLVAPGFRSWEPSAYIQDDWRARRWLTVNMGVRYDIYTPYTERHGRLVNFDPANGVLVSPSLPGINQSSSTGNVATNHLNVAPRLGFAATLKHSMVVRGGFGLSFYPNNYQSAFAFKNAPYSFSVNCQVQNQGGTNASCIGLPLGAPASVVAQYGSAPGPGSKVNGAGFAAMPLGLPTPTLNINNVLTPAGCNIPFQTSTPACKAPTNPYASSAIGSIVWPNFPWPYLEQFNLQIEKAFSDNVVTIGYVGELGIHQPSNLVLNSITNPTQTARPLAGEFPWLATNNINPNYNEGKSSYHALQVSFERRFSHGLTANVNYTWAHALVNSFSQSGAGGAGGAGCTPSISPQDLGIGTAPKTPINPCFYDTPGKLGTTTVVSTLTSWYSVGNSTEDVHDRIGGTINYEVPFGKSLTGVEGIFAKGWTLNAAGSWQTGLPFTVGMGINVTNTPTTGPPDQICSGKATNPSISNWINANCFQKPAQGLFGDEHANQLFGPSQRVLNFSFFKTFNLTEWLHLQFRTEVFNLFNTPNFSVPAPTLTNFNSSNIAQNTNGNGTFVAPITSLNPSETPRQIQFALKFLF